MGSEERSYVCGSVNVLLFIQSARHVCSRLSGLYM